MGQTRRISRNNTRIIKTPDGGTAVRLHNTDVVTLLDGFVTLDSGGWRTSTTKTRMNQTANQWGLGYGVYQTKGEWFVDTPHDGTLSYRDGMHFRTL